MQRNYENCIRPFLLGVLRLVSGEGLERLCSQEQRGGVVLGDEIFPEILIFHFGKTTQELVKDS